MGTEAVETFTFIDKNDGVTERVYGVCGGFARGRVAAMTFFGHAVDTMREACLHVPVALRLSGGMVNIRRCLDCLGFVSLASACLHGRVVVVVMWCSRSGGVALIGSALP